MNYRWIALAGIVFATLPRSANGGIVSTKHNLSASGPGTVRAASEGQICIFCHTPHNSSPRGPLWNRRDPGGTYIPYSSSTATASPGQPTGVSILCLSCHDGTIAVGDVLSRPVPISMVGGVTTIPTGSGRLGTDLSDDHPISFQYTESMTQKGQLVSPSSLGGKVRLDPTGQLQCTSCHDPHDDANGKFLAVSNLQAALCTACHTPTGWTGGASHRDSLATWNRAGPDPWPHTDFLTVAENGCENCHRPHHAGGRQRLLNRGVEEDNCYPCHNGNVAPENLQGEFSKSSRHPVDLTLGVHDPAEPAVAANRHVECADCHNPHAARPGDGALAGVRGVDSSGAAILPASAEYQVCYRCHADSPGLPAPRTPRQLSQTNTRLEFSRTNPSFHPVEGPGVNPNVPSLISPYTTASVIGCGDCHGNNAGPGAGGSGPSGPHGSVYPLLLERQYLTADGTPESSSAYALCYKCHSRTSILGDASFGEHGKHIQGERTPCNACHDPHGVSSTQGTPANHGKLINFDVSVVQPRTDGSLRFESRGTFRGACYLRCHGKDHNGLSY